MERSERLLVQVLKMLVNLESFKWDRWWPVINQGSRLFDNRGEFEEGSGPIYEEDIWTALRDHTQVRRILAAQLGDPRLGPLDTMPLPIGDCTVSSSYACLRSLIIIDFHPVDW